MGRAKHSSYRVSERVANTVRLGALIYAVIWVVYSIAVALELVSQPPSYPGNTSVYMLGALWLALAWYVYKQPSRNTTSMVRRFTAYHLLSGMYLILITGAQIPLIALCALMIASGGVYFGYKVSAASSFVLIVGAALAYAVNHGSAEQALPMVMAVIVAIFSGMIAAHTVWQTLRDQHELDASRNEAQLEHDQMMTLINNLTDAVFSTDQHGTIMLYNAALLNLLDTNTDLEGNNIDDILRLRTVEGERVSLTEDFYDTTTVNIRDDLVTTISNEETRLEISYSPIRGGFDDDDLLDDIGGFIVIVRDVTSSKSLEEERDEFISVVSHELRTPITIAEGTVNNAQVMLARKDVASQKIKAAIDVAHEQIIFLARMVNDLSTLSRAERGVADEPEPIEVSELVKGLYREYQDEAKAKGLRFDLQVTDTVGSITASRLYLKELLQNFITNAIKYTKTGSIKLEAKRTTGGIVTFAVSDTGIGISRADQKRIFQKFYRAEDFRTRETSGTGLGLYVAAKLARKLGTTIEVKSRLNYGSTFSISLPLLKGSKPVKKP